MNKNSASYDYLKLINNQWLVHCVLRQEDEAAQAILDMGYFHAPIRLFLEQELPKDEQGHIAPSKMELDELITLFNGFFGSNVYQQFVTDAEQNLMHYNEVYDDEDGEILESLLIPNTIEFRASMTPVIPMSTTMIPEALQGYIINSARNMDNSPMDFTAIAAFTCLAAVIGHNVQIQPKKHTENWKVAVNLWAALIGPPSSKKTPSINHGIKLLEHAVDTILEPRNTASRKAYNAQLKIHNATKKVLEKELYDAVASGDNAFAKETAQKIANLEKPTLNVRDFLLNDTTQEALAKKLSQNDNGVLCVRDELPGRVESMNKQNQSHARAFYLEAYNGSTNYTVERIASDSFTIELMLMSLLGGIQPSKLAPLLEARQNGDSDDGLMERLIQFSVFPDFQGSEYIDRPFDPEHETRAKRLFENAARLDRASDPLICTFSDESQKLWDSWATEHANRLNVMSEGMQAIYGKQPTVCAKLAVIFHLIDQLDTESVDFSNLNSIVEPTSLTLAFSWISYLDSHIVRITEYAKENREITLAKDLLSRLKKLEEDKFTVKEISSKGWATFKKIETREQALSILVRHNYLLLEETPSGTRTKRIYTKHPSLLAEAK
ncbi:TPA: DUF3987 domain-containing protein [Vibrio parahaemolyticus]|nr:DUF3987 domain-containing protein [Vibrio parahaemolyticus]HCH0725459.1 DUF3987 domain-containing protein [Vibrio parahaemolyticus]HCH1053905.1 DUF3987 domain-containing protein [Vibrio parahaemolyticus]